MSEDRAERLARQIRSACGQYNNDDLPVVLCVTQMRGRILELKAKLAAAESQPAVQEECKKCGDKLRHDDDGPDVCRWCSSGFMRSDDLDCATAESFPIDAARGASHE